MRSLPRLLLLTDRTQILGGGSRTALLDLLDRCLRAGLPAVVLRELDLDPGARAELAREAGTLTRQHGALLITARCHHASADGVHLAAGQPIPVGRPGLVGRSCHNREDVDGATDADYVTISPLALTASKPGYGPALGLDRSGALAAATCVPAYALGGLTPQLTARLPPTVHGVAVMGDVMRDPDPDRRVREYLAVLQTGRHRAG